MFSALFVLLFAVILGFSVKNVFGCSKQVKANLLVLDGVNVAETPSLLVEIEALNVPVTLAVSLQDLRDFPTVRLIAREAAMRGHDVILSTGEATGDVKREWAELLDGYKLKYTTKSVEYTLDLSPDHINVIPQLVKERIAETPSLGRVIYLNSFVMGAKGKALSAIQTYQAAGFQFVTLSACLQRNMI